MSIFDEEFGEIKVRKSKLARSIKISIGVDGILKVSAPYFTSDFLIVRTINRKRDEIRQQLKNYLSLNIYRDGDLIGKTHTLIFRESGKFKIEVSGNQILVFSDNFEGIIIQSEIRKIVVKILKKQAKAYLPRRINFLAEKHGFYFEKLRFPHTGTRWGSCSSCGTISLNIALMNLPHHLIDYVIIHELCHTRQMNHSSCFWAEVEKYDPEYRTHVEEIKKFSPHI